MTKNVSMIALISLVLGGGCQEVPSDDGQVEPYSPHRSEEQTEYRIMELVTEDDSNGQITLGRGYNVFGDYANPLDVTLPVLNYSALEGDGLIDIFNTNTTQITMASGSSIEEYANAMSVNANLSGNLGSFSGSVETNFASSTRGKLQNSYATMQMETFKRKIQIIDTDRTLLQGYLSAQALADINNPNVSAAVLIDKYGSHVVTGMYLGARLDYSMVTDMSAFESSQSIDVAVEASFNGLFSSASLGVDTSFEDELSQFEEHSSTTLRVYGGASEYTLGGLTEGNYTEWLSSIEDNQVFVGYAGYEPLIPLWELVADGARASEIEAAYDAKVDGLRYLLEDEPTLFEISAEMITTNFVDLGGNNGLDVYGELLVTWEDEDAIVQTATLFDRGTSDFLIVPEDEMTPLDEGPVQLEFVFDRASSYIEISGQLMERDDSNSDEDLGLQSVTLGLDEILAGEGVLTYEGPDGEGLEVHYSVSILD